jgi:hypothetical protein
MQPKVKSDYQAKRTISTTSIKLYPGITKEEEKTTSK